MTHDLKIDNIYFEDVLKGIKNFEIRYNDRNYKVGDSITLNEIDSLRNYTGRRIKGIIEYITDYQQKPGYVVFGFKKIDEMSQEAFY